MGRLTATIGVMGAAALLAATAAGAQGVIPDRPTVVTISAPISLPGVVLPEGTYLFRLAGTQASRNVIQVTDKDRTKVYATLITVTAERSEPTGDSVITFRETSATQAPALRYWYYAGEKGGHEFVYPKEQAMKIARASGESVLAIDAPSADSEEMKSGEISRIDGARAQAEPSQPAMPERPAPAPAQAAPPAQPSEPLSEPSRPAETSERPQAAEPAPAPMTGSAAQPQPTGTSGRMPAPASERAELPRTASGVPLAGLIGMLAVGAALGTRALRRRLTF